MLFLVDAQLPPALAALLRARGHEASHVNDVGLGEASDRHLWEYALRTGAAIVTTDEDFSHMVARSEQGPSIVWLRVGNTRRVALLDWFEPLMEEIARLVEDGQRLIEVR